MTDCLADWNALSICAGAREHRNIGNWISEGTIFIFCFAVDVSDLFAGTTKGLTKSSSVGKKAVEVTHISTHELEKKSNQHLNIQASVLASGHCQWKISAGFILWGKWYVKSISSCLVFLKQTSVRCRLLILHADSYLPFVLHFYVKSLLWIAVIYFSES